MDARPAVPRRFLERLGLTCLQGRMEKPRLVASVGRFRPFATQDPTALAGLYVDKGTRRPDGRPCPRILVGRRPPVGVGLTCEGLLKVAPAQAGETLRPRKSPATAVHNALVAVLAVVLIRAGVCPLHRVARFRPLWPFAVFILDI